MCVSTVTLSCQLSSLHPLLSSPPPLSSLCSSLLLSGGSLEENNGLFVIGNQACYISFMVPPFGKTEKADLGKLFTTHQKSVRLPAAKDFVNYIVVNTYIVMMQVVISTGDRHTFKCNYIEGKHVAQ